jgi:hypothetical protein
VPYNRIRPFGSSLPIEYWLAICQELENGAIPLEVLKNRAVADAMILVLQEALKQFPANQMIPDLVRRLEADARDRPAPSTTRGPLIVLFLSGNPPQTDTLRIGREQRAIREICENTGGRAMQFRDHLAVAPSELLQSLDRFQPALVHLSCHGENGSLMLEGADGACEYVSPEQLAELVASFCASPKCRLRGIVLSACHSSTTVQALARHVDFAIGMDEEIADPAALAFATGFYTGLRDPARSIQNAIDMGRAQIRMLPPPDPLYATRNAAAGAKDPYSPERVFVAAREGVKLNELFL